MNDMEYSSFDLEQQILACWNVTSDVQTVLDYTETLHGIPPEQFDQLQNMLVGIVSLYDQKFDKLFALFEASLKAQK